LFVDDEVKVLDGLRRMLRGMRHEWQMTFMDDPAAAVQRLGSERFDAVVVDMRMPKMDGATFLALAKESSPGTARIVLSGEAERGAALRAVGLAHQLLAKPCDPEALRTTVSRACQLRRLLRDVGLADVVGRLGRLPSQPALYQSITEEMRREEVSLKRVADIVGRDIAMSAKVLQLVNSAFFGLGRRVSSIYQAVSYLGVDVIRALVTSHAVFAALDANDRELFQQTWDHSVVAARLAKRVVEAQTDDATVSSDAMQAGLLHDIGSLVLCASFKNEYRTILSSAGHSHATMVQRELEAFQCDHGPMGAYLMGLWGFSDRIVEAIAYHARPSECSYQRFSALSAVHVACALLQEADERYALEAELDVAYVERVGLGPRLDDLRAEAKAILSNDGETHDQT
jgi:HD-like signal output (HDOD) protein